MRAVSALVVCALLVMACVRHEVSGPVSMRSSPNECLTGGDTIEGTLTCVRAPGPCSYDADIDGLPDGPTPVVPEHHQAVTVLVAMSNAGDALEASLTAGFTPGPYRPPHQA